jgi:galactokinase
LNADETFEFDLDRPGPPRRRLWLDYVEGVAQSLEARGARLRGADLLLKSDVPEGAGLSSSAALEVSSGFALLSLSGLEVDRVMLALAGQKAEHEYVGTKCGIMDQLTAALARRGAAMLIDCRSLETQYFPLDTSHTVIAVCDTQVKHELASSQYNARRAECEQGVAILRHYLSDIRALRDVSVADFRKHEEHLPEPVRRRCRHVITENERTLAAAAALGAGKTEEMGQLMFQSHQSLRDDYEVSCLELDVLVDAAARAEGVYGARMTGGGFGGCTVSLVRKDALESFRETVTQEYLRATGIHPVIYIVQPGDGAKEVT